jgi:hypothetical protein
MTQLTPLDATDAKQLGLTLGVHLKNRPPDERAQFMEALAIATGEPWQKVEAIIPRGRGYRREKCACQITQYRLAHREPTFFACTKYATWRINGYAMCGTHANAFVWERVLGENGYNAHSDGILIQDGLRPPEGRKEPTG